ncbi:ATP-binding protein [Actinomadura viridis]|uniref:Anti-sigma regulatory factor (Ser/Thr protein kinase) n=1 Tax=Actinomadura viridis TaxID=58110 RepID=A0A931DCM9_9ACTN|nr:ATP-binding protein [Actinomadura viridis]MBG6087715.1 anti-sigma regulatory factor (Ser/Thr protein kinase) [Actinomadura viridis]
MIGTVTLAAVPESVAEARSFAAALLAGDLRAETAELLISEACTNSVVHSESRFGGKFTLRLCAAGDALRCEVVDDGSQTVPVRRDGEDDEPRENGYGVMLIETLADRSGHFLDDGRLCAWFELD